MKNLKRISLLLLSVLLIFTFAGCDRGKVTEEETTEEEVTVIQPSQENGVLFDYAVPMEPAKSENASEIIETLLLNKNEFKYETLDETKKIPLVYSIYKGVGYDINGREYNKNTQLTGNCPYCEQLRGIGEDMCQGFCNIEPSFIAGIECPPTIYE